MLIECQQVQLLKTMENIDKPFKKSKQHTFEQF